MYSLAVVSGHHTGLARVLISSKDLDGWYNLSHGAYDSTIALVR